MLGLEVRPLYRDPDSGEIYDRVMRSFGRQVSHALKKTFFSFALNRTNVRPEHYFSFGSSRLSKQVLAVDRQLADLSRQFKFSVARHTDQCGTSMERFFRVGYRKAPVLQYRPLDADPLLLKRRVTKVATENVEDPTLSYVFRQTQYELDRQITMLADIGTFRFLPGSLQVFGGVKPGLRELLAEDSAVVGNQQPTQRSVRHARSTRVLPASGERNQLLSGPVLLVRGQSHCSR